MKCPALARANQKKAGVANVEFLKGEIENIPLPDNSVDVVISNCVINLSADKDRVLAKPFASLNQVAVSPSPTWLPAAMFLPLFAKTCCCGSGALRARSETMNTSLN